MGAAGIIGTSWIYTNGEFFAAYGAGGEIFGLAIATVLASFIAMSYAELASKFPRAGGEIVYGYVAFNRTISFVGGWLLIGAYVSSLAFYVTASGTLLSQLFPSLETIPLYSIAGTEVYLPMLLVGAALAVLVCVVNCYGTGLGAGTQLVFFCLMLVIGAVLVVVGFAAGSPSNFWPPYEPGGDAFFSTLRFILPAMTFLTGFSLVAILAEDADLRPANIGKIVVAAVVIAGTFYCAVLLASAWIIPWTKTATLEQGTIDTYRVAGFPALGWGAYTISVLGLVTSFLALFVAASRIMLGLARAGLFPRAFAKVSERRGTPVNALLFTLALCLGLGWLGEGALTWFLDTGGVYTRREIPIGPDDTAADLRSALTEIGAALLVETLSSALPDPEPQVGTVTYADKLDPGELQIDWSRPAVEIHRLVRVGGAWTTIRGRRLKVWATRLDPAEDGVTVPAGDGPIELVEVQPEGRARMTARAWAHGVVPEALQQLGS
ncbi:MAG: amino acid permease [Acidimicrobiales bacterium]